MLMDGEEILKRKVWNVMFVMMMNVMTLLSLSEKWAYLEVSVARMRRRITMREKQNKNNKTENETKKRTERRIRTRRKSV